MLDWWRAADYLGLRARNLRLGESSGENVAGTCSLFAARSLFPASDAGSTGQAHFELGTLASDDSRQELFIPIKRASALLVWS
jgi:hypothetical protein